MLDTIFPIFFISMQDGFRITAGSEEMAAGHKLLPQFRKVIHFTVKNYTLRPVFIKNRLTSGT